jgi:1-deoxy-D-xylulose-5-phosphate reductoisomerase
MTPRKIVLLGSTGSIGRCTLDVVKKHPGCFDVVALAAYSNVDLLVEQYHQFRPKYVCLVDQSKGKQLSQHLRDKPVKVLVGEAEMVQLAGLDNADLVVNAVVGAAGLPASLEAIKKGKCLALANKESLVSGGPLFPSLVKKTNGKILPIDSEASAIWQALACGKADEVKTVILTASGGPFRDYPIDQFDQITLRQALAHPTWKMGPKITIDCATLVNKGLEIIEASVLFSMPTEKIKVVIHPQSIVHSMVEFIDSSIIAQLSRPDMRLPITYALFWPERVESDWGQIDLNSLDSLTFEKPDFNRFPALPLAYSVAQTGGTAPAIFNAANEEAVSAFLDGSIRFPQITDTIEHVVNQIEVVSAPELDDIVQADRKARATAKEKIGKAVCC